MNLDTNVLVAFATALGVILAGWFTLRGNWDRRLLSAFSDEMGALRARVATLEARVTGLQKELDQAQGALYIAQRDLDVATRGRDQFAEQNVKQAAHIITLEASVARLKVQVEALTAQQLLSGKSLSDAEAIHSGDAVTVVKE